MFANPQITFMMPLLYYAQCLGYKLCTIFLFLGILLHYAEFDSCSMVMLEKLLGSRFLKLQGVIWLVIRSLYLLFQSGLAFLQWFDLLPFPFWDVEL